MFLVLLHIILQRKHTGARLLFSSEFFLRFLVLLVVFNPAFFLLKLTQTMYHLGFFPGSYLRECLHTHHLVLVSLLIWVCFGRVVQEHRLNKHSHPEKRVIDVPTFQASCKAGSLRASPNYQLFSRLILLTVDEDELLKSCANKCKVLCPAHCVSWLHGEKCCFITPDCTWASQSLGKCETFFRRTEWESVG